MSLSAVIDALAAAGCSADQIAAAVRAHEGVRIAAEATVKTERRAKDAERQRRHRLSRDVTVTVCDERDQRVPTGSPEDNTQTPITTTQTGEATPPSRDRPKSELAQAVEIYNSIAGKAGWSKADTLSDARKGKLRGRVKDAGGLVGWNDTLERGARSNFLLGDNDKGWKPGLDFFLSQEKFTKLMEGFYDNRTQNRSSDRGNGIGPAIERLHARIDGGRNHGAVVLDDELPLDAGRGMPGFARRFS